MPQRLSSPPEEQNRPAGSGYCARSWGSCSLAGFLGLLLSLAVSGQAPAEAAPPPWGTALPPAVGPGEGSNPAAADGGRPPIENIVLVTLDTTRADHLSCYGYPLLTTP
ncbi:MAG: hypothetical protein ACE5ID_10630, partial [Acidobacteriota bacterium]